MNSKTPPPPHTHTQKWIWNPFVPGNLETGILKTVYQTADFGSHLGVAEYTIEIHKETDKSPESFQ